MTRPPRRNQAVTPMLRTSERAVFKRCRFRWKVTHVDQLRPRTAHPALRFGTLVHKALEAYYIPGLKRGPHPAETFQTLYAEELEEQTSMGFRDQDGEWHEAAGLGVSMLEGYVEHYKERDREYKVIASEQIVRVPIRHGKKRLVTYVCTIDGVWQRRENKRLLFVDHKTAASIDTGYLTLDEQGSSYWTYGPRWLEEKGLLPAKANFEGIMFNFLAKTKADERPTDSEGRALNQDRTVSKKQPARRYHRELVIHSPESRRHLHERVIQEAQEIAAVRAGELAAYKNPGKFTCMGCPAREICELHEEGADWQTFRDQTMETFDPYETYNK